MTTYNCFTEVIEALVSDGGRPPVKELCENVLDKHTHTYTHTHRERQRQTDTPTYRQDKPTGVIYREN